MFLTLALLTSLILMVRTSRAALRKFTSTNGHVDVHLERQSDDVSGQTNNPLRPKPQSQDPTTVGIATFPSQCLLTKMSTQPPSPAMSAISIQWQPYSTFPLDPALSELNNVQNGSNTPVSSSVSTISSMQELNLLSYDIRDRVQKQFLSDTTTQRHYEKYLKDYID